MHVTPDKKKKTTTFIAASQRVDASQAAAAAGQKADDGEEKGRASPNVGEKRKAGGPAEKLLLSRAICVVNRGGEYPTGRSRRMARRHVSSLLVPRTGVPMLGEGNLKLGAAGPIRWGIFPAPERLAGGREFQE